MFKLNDRAQLSYKIGLDEVKDLKQTMKDLLRPVQKALKSNIYWSDIELDQVEYKSRDGFIANPSNCGGVQINQVIPKCEEYKFSYLDFGDYDHEHNECTEYECVCDVDGHLDAALNIWFKFEGLDSNGVGSFYLVLFGGNGDAPYFRSKYLADIFERDFEASSLDELRRKASKPIHDLIKLIKKG